MSGHASLRTSDTTGEKDYEEFFTSGEVLDLSRFENIGVIKNEFIASAEKLKIFTDTIQQLKTSKVWTKEDLLDLFLIMIPDFDHKETGKYLDAKM